MDLKNNDKRELRAVNRSFSLGEYGESWTKLERYLFVEIYNVIKEFYISASDENIKTFSSESILLTLPIKKLDTDLFKPSQKNRDLMNAAEGLSKKQINLKSIEEGGQWGFSFISMFPEITFDPSRDKENMLVRIPSRVFEEMVPIKSYCLLDFKLLSVLNSGNTIRLYEIFKSYAFRKNITLSFEDLRKHLGFFKGGVYEEWKYFNAKVLKPAINSINSHKEYDIEVIYNKRRGADDIDFTIITHLLHDTSNIQVLNLNQAIEDRKPNLIQSKYIKTVLEYCNKELEHPLNDKEITEWIVSDLISSRNTDGENFDFKHCMNAISKQIREKEYTKPYSHKHLQDNSNAVFSDEVYTKIKSLHNEGQVEEILNNYSAEIIKLHHFGYLLEE